ncbi:MAG: PIG-L family deacetylase [Firmicutes bacterium]|nr:PIG-L family deacetylase [Bacillota bacterium]
MYIELLKQIAPIPEIEQHEKVVFIGAHPDDIEIGAGGTVDKLIKLKKEVNFVIMTDGGSGSRDVSQNIEKLIETRKKESEEAAAFLGVKKVYFLDFPDGGYYEVFDAAKKLATVLLELNPDLVVCSDPNLPSEIHPDHIKCGEASNLAIIMAAFPLMFVRNHLEINDKFLSHFRPRTLAYYYTHRPNQTISLSNENVSRRSNAIQKHKSQFKEFEDYQMIHSYLEIHGKALGLLAKSIEAEGFFVLGPVHQHCFPEVNHY